MTIGDECHLLCKKLESGAAREYLPLLLHLDPTKKTKHSPSFHLFDNYVLTKFCKDISHLLSPFLALYVRLLLRTDFKFLIFQSSLQYLVLVLPARGRLGCLGDMSGGAGTPPNHRSRTPTHERQEGLSSPEPQPTSINEMIVIATQ